MARDLANAIPRYAADIAGERVSIFTFGALANGVSDDKDAFDKAVADLTAAGGGEIYFPGGYDYAISQMVIPVGAPPITLVGDGEGSHILRVGSLPSGQGFLDISASNFRARRIRIDGNVLTPVGVNYSSITLGDPMVPLLSDKSSIWVHGGTAKLVFEEVIVEHTGGYALLLDARYGDIDDVDIINGTYRWNRPHLFGTSDADLNYGSWTSGIHYQGDGYLYAVSNLKVRGNTFKGCTGNAVWGHLYAFDRMHTNHIISHNHFEDIGLDAIEPGGLIGGSVDNNTMRRIGYIMLADDGPVTPRWLNGAYATGLDTTGLVLGCNYTDNVLISCNGGYINADGLACCTVSGNSCRTPRVTDPEYVEDQIGLTGWGGGSSPGGPNWVSGFISSNSSDKQGGDGIIITGNTFINCSGGAILLYAGRNCQVYSNNIEHPADANRGPIAMGTIGTGPRQRAYSNTICVNRISYSPASAAPCVYEDSGYGAFDPTDKNFVSANTIIGNGQAYEFKKDPVTASVTEVRFSSNLNALSVGSSHLVQREGKGADYTSALRWYHEEGVTKVLHMQLQGYTRSAIHKPLLNISAAGASNSGVYATGDRTNSALDDALVTGKVYSDSFTALTDTTFDDAHANVLPATVFLWRYDSGTAQLKYSNEVLSGARVWHVFSISVGGTDKSVQYNKAGAFFGDGNFYWDYTAQSLAVIGVVGQAAITCNPGYMHSYGGFLSSTAAWNAIQGRAAGGGAYMAGYKVEDIGGKGGYMQFVAVSYADFPIVLTGGAFAGTDIMLWSAGANGTVTPVTAKGLNTNSFLNAAAGFYTGYNAYNSIQAPVGGLYVGLGVTTDQAVYPKLYAVSTSLNVPASGYGGWGYKGGSAFWYYSTTTAAWASLDLLDPTFRSAIAGVFNAVNTGFTYAFQTSTTSFVVDFSGNISGTGAINMTGANPYKVGGTTIVDASRNATFAAVTSSGVIQSLVSGASIGFQINAGGAGVYNLQIDGNGNLSSAGQINVTGASPYKVGGTEIVSAARIATFVGTVITGSAYNSLQATAGGCYVVLGYTTDQALYPKGYASSASLNTPAAGYGGFGYKSGAVYWYYNGSAWAQVDFSAAGGGGVTSITGTTNQVIASASTGAVTLSLPQSIATSSSVTFADVTVSGVFQSTATGATIVFQTTNTNIQINANGTISIATNMNLNGSSSKIFFAASNAVGLQFATLGSSSFYPTVGSDTGYGLSVNGGSGGTGQNGRIAFYVGTALSAAVRLIYINPSGMFPNGTGIKLGDSGSTERWEGAYIKDLYVYGIIQAPNGNAGVSTTATVRNSAGTGTSTFTISGGVITAYTP